LPEAPPKKSKSRFIVFLVLVLLLVGGGTGYYLYGQGRVSTDDAYIDGRVFVVTPRVGGYVVEVAVEDNQPVKKGQRLLVLDPTEYQVSLAEARAALAAAEATLTSLELGVPLQKSQTEQQVKAAEAQAEALRRSLERIRQEERAAAEEVRRAEAVHQQAQLDLQRMKILAARGAVAQSSLDTAQTNARTTQAQVGAARANLQTVAKQRASTESELEGLLANVRLAATGEDVAAIKDRQVAAQKEQVRLAQARVEQAELNLSYTTVASPADGHVTKKSVEPGQMVARGQSLLAVVPLEPKELWVTANLKETQLTHVQVGQPVEIRVDAYPGLKLKGRVESIMAGTGAAFSLFPPENASGNFVKVVQRVPVRIALEAGADPPRLRLGMSVIPTIFIDPKP